MCPILRQTIYSLMPLWLGVASPLIGVNWIRLDYLSLSLSQVGLMKTM
ncbi:Uncharacterised protein [Mycobacterium tuberculosis]|nr:Uncharacterised protein [Mycobacterium tuberculosis]